MTSIGPVDKLRPKRSRGLAGAGRDASTRREGALFLSGGPQPAQYRAYAGEGGAQPPPQLRPGTTGDPIPASDFYKSTRQKYFPATFSLISGFAPLAVFGGTVALVAWLLADDKWPPALGLMDNGEAVQLPMEAYCRSSEAHGPLLNAVLAGTLHFSGTHVALISVCLLAFVVSAASALNVLRTHGRPRLELLQWFIAAFLPITIGAAAFFAAYILVGNQIAQLFGRLPPVVAPTSGCGILGDATKLRNAVDLQMQIGAGLVAIAVASLIIAAACLAYRYELNDINGAWSDSYVLRHKLNSLLTLFFIGSILLVLTNIALSSAMEWSSDVLDVVSNATSADPSETGPGPDPANTVGATISADAAAAKAAFASVKLLKTLVADFAGILGSLLLIVIFVPALYAMTSEIELAGKCHAFYDTYSPSSPSQTFTLAIRPARHGARSARGRISRDPGLPAANIAAEDIVVAGWKTVQDWKNNHGLSMSYTSLTGSFVAALAPLLSSSIIDLTKVVASAS